MIGVLSRSGRNCAAKPPNSTSSTRRESRIGSRSPSAPKPGGSAAAPAPARICRAVNPPFTLSRLVWLQLHPMGVLPPLSAARPNWAASCRSEEHTSELQSLMRISYAVFCLKKKKKTKKLSIYNYTTHYDYKED